MHRRPSELQLPHPLRAAMAAFPLAATLTVLPLAAVAAPEVAWPLAPYAGYVHALATGAGEQALAQFAPDALVVAGPHCTAARPCRGTAAIQAGFLRPTLAAGLPPPVVAQQFDGRQLRAHGPAIVPATHWFELRGGRIASLRVEPDARPAAPCVADAGARP